MYALMYFSYLCRLASNLIRSLAVPVAVVILLCLLSTLFAHYSPDMIADIYAKNIEYQIIKKQIIRLNKIKSSEIVILGDSSGLMGIDPNILNKRLGKKVESFCTLGVVGPEGYAYMLDLLYPEKDKIEYIIFALHPIQFHRVPSWEAWIGLIKKTQSIAPIDIKTAGLDFVRSLTNSYLIYSPLPGYYSSFYGSPENFIGMIGESKGSAIDPLTGLQFGDLVAFINGTPNYGYASVDLETLTITSHYLKALNILKQSISAFGREKIILILSPIPIGEDKEAIKSITASFQKVANILNIPPSNAIIPRVTFSIDFKYFSSITHLNRYGKIIYSNEIVKELSPLVGAR